MIDRTPHRLASTILLIVLILTIAGCQSAEEIKMNRAQQVLGETMAKSAETTEYGLRVISGSSATYGEAIVTGYLGAVNPRTATAAAVAARERGMQAQTEALKTMFNDKVGTPQIEAAHTLATFGDAEALAWLQNEAAGTPNPRVIVALVDIGDAETARASIEKMLVSEDQSIRDEAYVLLSEIEEPWSLELVVAGLKKEHGEGREQAIRALGKLGDASHAYQIQRFINTRGLVYATLEALGELGDEKSIPDLQESMKRPETLVQIYAAAALWKLGKGDEASPVLEPLVRDEEIAIRMDLAQQLAGIEDDKAIGMLLFLAEDDPDGRVRKIALQGLYDTQGAGVYPALVACSADTDYQVAVVALDGLSQHGKVDVVDQLEPLLEHENPYLVISAANAMVEILNRAGGAPAS
jgi:HEAT repeat protein